MSEDGITLWIDRADEIVFPSAIIDGDLTLAEIGAAVVLAVVAKNQSTFDHRRFLDADMTAAVSKLKERGVFTVTVKDGGLNVAVDLDKAMPPDTE